MASALHLGCTVGNAPFARWRGHDVVRLQAQRPNVALQFQEIRMLVVKATAELQRRPFPASQWGLLFLGCEGGDRCRPAAFWTSARALGSLATKKRPPLWRWYGGFLLKEYP